MSRIQVVRYDEFQAVASTTTNKKPPKKERASRQVREFSAALNWLLKEELRLATRYVNADITQLSGRPVSGGLPSLGRR